MSSGSQAPGPACRPAVPEGRPLVLGVLGGIASGKSEVARLLAAERGLVLDADLLAREVLDSPEGVALVRERFGPAALGADGRPDRAALARLAFDPAGGREVRAALESWTHPRVRDRILARLSEARAAGVPRVVLDVPLLLENDADHGLARLCDVLVFVDTDAGARDRRAQRERGWPSGEVARREAAQLPLEEKRRRAHHVIRNNQGRAELLSAVHELLEELRASS